MRLNLNSGQHHEEINKFKITGLITRSTRGVYSEQGFIILILKHFLIIPFVFIGIVIEIAFIDKIFAGLFAGVIIIIFLISIIKLKQVTAIYFKAKATYGKINLLFLSKINSWSITFLLINKSLRMNLKMHAEILMIRTFIIN